MHLTRRAQLVAWAGDQETCKADLFFNIQLHQAGSVFPVRLE